MKIVFTSGRSAERLAAAAAKVICALIILLMVAAVLTRALSAAGAVRPPFDPEHALRGYVRPARATSIHAEIPGRVSAVLVAPGDSVQPGQILVETHDDEVATLVESARIRFNRAQASLAAVQRRGADGIRSQVQQEKYRLALKVWEAAQKRLGGFTLLNYENAHQAAKNRLDLLLAEKNPPKPQVERLERVLLRETRALEFAREHFARLREEAEVADSRLKIEKIHLKLDEGAALSSARTAYQDAMLELRAATQRSTRLRVTAPRAATVVGVPALPGDRVYPGAPLVELADLTSLEVEVPLSAKQLALVKAGDSVTVRLPVDPEMDLAASVTFVAQVPDPQRNAYAVRIRIGNPKPGAILAGLDCAVDFPRITESQKPRWRRLLGL